LQPFATTKGSSSAGLQPRPPPIAAGDESRLKKTWNSISRANSPSHAPGAAREWPELLSDFLVFASFAGPGFGAFDRNLWHIWYFEDDELHETDLDLAGFIRTVAREVRDFG